MERIYEISQRLTDDLDAPKRRYLYDRIAWSDRLIMIKGACSGDFLLDRRYTFEVGGRNKGFSQIADKPDSYVIADNIETGFGNKIPIWLLGFLY